MITPKISRREAEKYSPEFCKLVKDFCESVSHACYAFSGYYVPRELLQAFDERRHDFIEVISEVKQCVIRFEKSNPINHEFH